MSTDTSTSVGSAEQSYTDEVQTYFDEAEADLATITACETQIENDQNTIKKYSDQEKSDEESWINGIMPSYYDDDEAYCEEQIAKANADITEQMNIESSAYDDLATLGGMGAELDSLEESQEDLNAEASTVAMTGSQAALDQWKADMNLILQAMQEQLQANYLAAEMNDPDVTTAEAQGYSTQYIQYENSVNSTLMTLIGKISKDIVSWNALYNSENEKKSNFTPLQEWFCDAGKQEQELQKVMDIATKMISGLEKVMSDLAGAVGSSAVAVLTQMLLELQSYQEQALEIMNDPTLTNSQKAADMTTIVILMLALYEAFKGEVESLKSSNETLMAQGTLDATQMSISDAQSATKILQEKMHAEFVMKIFTTVVTAVMALTMCLTAGFIMAAIVLAFSAYDIATTWDPNAKKMSDLLGGGTKGDIYWSVIEAVATMGVGLAAERAVAYYVSSSAKAGLIATEAAAEAAETSEKSTLETAAKSSAKLDAAKEAANTGQVVDATRMTELTKHANAIAKNRLEKTLEAVMETASRLYSKQALGTVMSSSMSKLVETMQATLKMAADESIQFSGNLESAEIRVGEEQIGTEARELAARALSKNLGITIENARIAVNNTLTIPFVGTQVGWVAKLTLKAVAVFSLLAMMNNTLVDGAAATDRVLHRRGVITDAQYEGSKNGLQIAMEVMQAFVAMGVGFGLSMDTVTLQGSSTSWMRVANVLTQAGMAANGASQLAQAQNTRDKGAAIVAAALSRMIQDVLFQSLTQIQKVFGQDLSAMQQQISADAQSTQSMMLNSISGTEAAIRVLESSAV